MSRRRYPTDLSDAQWERLRPLLVRDPSKGGRPRTYPLREIINGLQYVLRGGISWRSMPHDLPPWDNVYDHFRRWKKDGTFEKIHDALRTEVRQKEGREATPSAVIIDTQSGCRGAVAPVSVRTTEKGDAVATTAARVS